MTPKRCKRRKLPGILSLLVIVSISLAVLATLSPAVSADTDEIVTTNASVNPEVIDINKFATTSGIDLDSYLTARVTLTVNSVNETEKVPVDVMHVIDRSGSMSWYSDVIHNSRGTLTSNWTNIGTFNVDSTVTKFDVLLETGSGSTTTQYLKIKSPSDEWYGSGNTPDNYPLEYIQNTYHQYDGADYIGIYDSDDVKNGTWEVHVKGYGEYDYVLSVQVPPIRFEAAKDAAMTFVGLMGNYDQICVVSFSSTATLNEQLTLLKSDVNTSIDSLKPSASYSPAIDAGIKAAKKELTSAVRSRDNAVKIMVLLSNGVNTARSEAAIEEAKDAATKTKRIKIFTIGFGEADHELLKEIASITGGEYYYAANGSDLEEIYETISEEITGISSRNYAFYVLSDDVEYAGNATIEPHLAIGNTLLWGINDLAPDTPWNVSFDVRPNLTMGENISVNVVQYSGVSYYLLGTITETTKVTAGGNFKIEDENFNLGFVVQRKTGEAWPEGELEFQDKAADIKLHSEIMEILAAEENITVYRGTGEVNDTSGYEFIVNAEKTESGGVFWVTITGPGNFSYSVKSTYKGNINVDPGSSEYVSFPPLSVAMVGACLNGVYISPPGGRYIGERVPVTGNAVVTNTGSKANISVTIRVDGNLIAQEKEEISTTDDDKDISVNTTWIPMSSGVHSVSIHVHGLKDDGTEFWTEAQGFPNNNATNKTIYIKKVKK